jgi:putative colanic acid biosynthesis UDP-glucose lipid carrier transferase
MITTQKSLYGLRIFIDLILINCSFIIAAAVAQPFYLLLKQNHMFILLLVLNITWIFSSRSTGLYDDFINRLFVSSLINISKNALVQTAVSVVFVFAIKEPLFTRNFILVHTIIVLITISARTVILKKILLRRKALGINVRNLLIIGAGEVGKNFYEMLKSKNDYGYNLVGFLDDESLSSSVLGKIEDTEKIIKLKAVNEIIIALPGYAYNRVDDIIKVCNRQAVRVHIIPDYFKFVSKKFQVGLIGDFPIITVRNEPLEEINWKIIKRLFDIIFSLLVIICIISWLFPIIFFLQKITSKGPIFFIQDRIGKDNKPFRCYKFRTMVVSNQKEKFIPTAQNDPRITKFGKFLRKSNLDELPQIFNVLIGNMSTVGPRPHAIPYNDMYKEIVEELKLRHLIKPGITGWAQIHGLRGDIADEVENRKRTLKRIEHDIWYIENWTLWLDIEIILLTVWQMLKADTKGY